MRFALIVIAMVAGCATHRPDVIRVVVENPSSTPIYVSGTDSRLMQAAAFSSAYRENWSSATGATPVIVGSTVYVSGTEGRIDLSVACPEGMPTNQEQLDACQNEAIRAVINTVGVE